MPDQINDGQGERYYKDFVDWREAPSDALEQRELRNALQRALNSLPRKCRELFAIRDVQHLKIREASEVLRITEGSVKARNALGPGIDCTQRISSNERKGNVRHSRS